MEPTRMTPLHWLAFVSAFAVFWIGLYFAGKGARIEKRRRLGGREPMTSDEFFNTYYAGTSIKQGTTDAVLRLVASSTGFPRDRLRPSDRFDRELRPIEGWEFDDGTAEVSWLAESIARNRDIRAEEANIRTLDDLIRFLDGADLQKDPGPQG